MRNILIISNSTDTTATYITNRFNKNANFYRLNFDEFQNYKISINNSGWMIENEDFRINNDAIYSIYYRKPLFPNLDEYNSLFHDYMKKEMFSVLTGVVESFNGIVLTKPSIMYVAENKIVQLNLAQNIGFNMPISLITNNNKLASTFYTSNKSIVKPISYGRIQDKNNDFLIQTNLVDNSNNNDLNMSPAYFQEYISKDFELRVTIIDRTFHSVKIESNNRVDWRRFNCKNKYSIFEIPDDLKQKCIQMMDNFNLSFGAFDFIAKDNQYYFLEVNPNGQWLWLEEELNLKISDNIFKKLME